MDVSSSATGLATGDGAPASSTSVTTADSSQQGSKTDAKINNVSSAGTVRLVSSDGEVFVIDQKWALASGTIKALLSSPNRFVESQDNVIEFDNIRGPVLSKICEYLEYSARYANSSTDIPEFPIPTELALDLLVAADYLDC